MKIFTSIVTLLISILQIEAQKHVSFSSEYIDFKIDDNYFSINGIYVFENNTGKHIHTDISFPFPVKTSLIDSIRIINMKNMQLVPYRKYEQNIIFNLSLSPFDTSEMNIYYRQPLAGKNSYILRSTKSWGTPLEKAVYTLTVIKNIKIISFSVEPDSSKTNSSDNTYYWTKFNYEPQSDFEIVMDR